MDNLYVVLICAYSLKICHNIGEIMLGLLAVLKRIRIDHLQKRVRSYLVRILYLFFDIWCSK